MAKFFTSLMTCISSVLKEETNIKDVEFVISSTEYKRFETMRDQVTRSFMGPDRVKALDIASTLWYSGRVYQSVVPSDRNTTHGEIFDSPNVFLTSLS